MAPDAAFIGIMIKARFSLRTLFVLLTVACVVIAWAASQLRLKHNAITMVWTGSRLLADGREYKWVGGGNEYEEPRVIVIGYYATKGRDRLIMKPGVVYSSDDPLPDMRGNVTMKSHWPPDSSVSGLYIDGVRQPLADGLNVAFVSNVSDPEVFVLSGADADTFFQSLDLTAWDDFFDIQVKPRLENWPNEVDDVD